MKRLASILVTVAALAAGAIALVMLVPSLAGYERYVILTGSMTGTYDAGSVVFAKPVPVAELEAGDVITYAPPAGSSPTRLVTHRIARIDLQPDGRRVFRTKGDANPASDPWTFTLPEAEQAQVRFAVPHLGRLVGALSDRETRMLVVGVPALLVALLILGGLVRDALRRPPVATPGAGRS